MTPSDPSVCFADEFMGANRSTGIDLLPLNYGHGHVPGAPVSVLDGSNL